MESKGPLIAGVFMLLALAVGIVFAAPLCMTTSCTPQERQLIVADATKDLAPAEACLVRELAMGEIADPLAIVGACSGATLLGLAQLTEQILASELDAAPPVEPDAAASGQVLSARTVRRTRLRSLRDRCRIQLLEGGAG